MTYEAWRYTHQSSEQAARAAFDAWQKAEKELEAIGAGGVEPLRKCTKLHQIAEPAASVEKQIEEAIDALVLAAFAEGGCSEHRTSEARIQTELRKKELRTMLSSAQSGDRAAVQAVQPFGWFITKSRLPGDTEFTQDPARENLARSFGYQTQPLYAQPASQSGEQAAPQRIPVPDYDPKDVAFNAPRGATPPLAPDHKGIRMHYTGLLRQAESALARGQREPVYADFVRQLCGHLQELGRSYYAGDMTVVDEFLQLYCIEEETRAMLVSASQPNGEAA